MCDQGPKIRLCTCEQGLLDERSMWVVFRANERMIVGSFQPGRSNPFLPRSLLFLALGAILLSLWIVWITLAAISLALIALLIMISWQKYSFLLSKGIERDLNSGNMFDFQFFPREGDLLVIYLADKTHAFKYNRWNKWKLQSDGYLIPDQSKTRTIAKGVIETIPNS
jgi:hypothetical protein